MEFSIKSKDLKRGERGINYLFFFLIYIDLFIIIFGYLFNNLKLEIIGCAIFFFAFLFWTVKQIGKRSGTFLFLICFFLFLMGQYVSFLFNKVELKFDDKTNFFILGLLLLSLGSIWIGNKFYELKKAKSSHFEKSDDLAYLSWVKAVEVISFWIFWLTLPLFFMYIMNRVNFVQETSYLEYYTSYSGENILFSYGQIICQTSFFIYLSTFPPKKVAKYLILAYLLINCLSINAGGRATAVSSIVLIVFYALYRDQNRYDNEELWIKRKYIIIAIICFPILLAFLSFWGYYRMDDFHSLSNMNISDHIWNFITTNGGSADIIGYTQKYKELLPETNLNYTFGYLINLIESNPLFGGDIYQQNTVQMALYGNSLGQTISYFVNPSSFLAGGGLGSCYIAELWVDFGIIGVIAFNLLLGYLLGYISNIKRKHVFQFVVVLVVMKSIFILPRETCLYVVRDLTSMAFIFVCLGIGLLAKGISKRRG